MNWPTDPPRVQDGAESSRKLEYLSAILYIVHVCSVVQFKGNYNCVFTIDTDSSV